MTEYEALKALLAAVQTLGEFWENRVTGDQLDDVDLMDVVLNAAEHAATGGRHPVCGHSRIVSGEEVEARSGGGNYVVYRHEGGDTIYKTSSAVCGRVAGHDGLHRGDNSRWSDDTPDWE